jgi:hypothetical protein
VELCVSNAREAPQNFRILAHFLSPVSASAELTPNTFMAGKPGEAVKRLTFEREIGHVENEPWIMSATPRRKPSAEAAL